MIEIHEKLYSYGKYINFIKNLYYNKKLPASIMLIGKGGIGKKSFITHLLLNIQKNIILTYPQLNNTDFVFHNKNDLNNIINNKHSNIKFVYNLENSSNITIDQIREITNYTKQSSFNGESKFIVICNPENLNIFAANSLLKILENPPQNSYFILISDSEKSLLSTIKSRCVKFNIKFSYNETQFILKNLLADLNLHTSYIINKFETPGSVVNRLKYITENNLNKNNDLEIIYFCLNDYRANKNKSSLIISIALLNNFFHKKMLSNFYSINNSYSIFKNKMIASLGFNSDINEMINFLKVRFK